MKPTNNVNTILIGTQVYKFPNVILIFITPNDHCVIKYQYYTLYNDGYHKKYNKITENNTLSMTKL